VDGSWRDGWLRRTGEQGSVDLLGRARMREIMLCKNLYVWEVDPRSEASVSTESITTFNGPGEAAELLSFMIGAKG
jgi:hypothetical protein